MSYIPGALTDDELRAAPVPVEGPLTDGELRAAPVPVAISSPVEISGRGTTGVAVFIQDQNTFPLDLEFLRRKSNPTLAVDTVVDARTVTLTAGHGAIAGDVLELVKLSNGSDFIQVRVLTVVGDVLTIDSPLNHVYTTTDSQMAISDDNMAVDGSVTPQIFSVNPAANQAGDINRVMTIMTGTSDMDFTTFGDIVGGLINGCVLRINNGDGTYRHIANFKNNGDIEHFTYDSRYFTNKAGGIRGFTARGTFNGQDKHGVAIRLDGALGESIELVVQDDLTPLESKLWLAQGSELQN